MTATPNEQLKESAAKLRDVIHEIEVANLHASRLAEAKNKLEADILPAIFAEVGVTECTLEDGSRLKLGFVATGSLPKEPDRRKTAIEWLVEHGLGDIIECKVTASYARGDIEKAIELSTRLQQDNAAKVGFEEGVNAKTLGKVAKDRVVAGEEVPLDVLGISVLSRARFTKLTNRNNGDSQ